MSTRIAADNGIEFEVCELGLSVIDHEDQTETWVRLTPEQRRALVDALDPQREGWNLADIARLRNTLANRPKPGPQPYVWGGVAPSEARQDADSLLYRAERAERERDEARGALEDERIVNGSMTTSLTEVARQRDEAQMERSDALGERDAAVARAEQAENARDTVATRAGQLEKALAGARHAHQRSADAHMEWKERALLAEDRLAEYHPAPAVTRNDVGNALMRAGVSNGIETHVEVSKGTDAVWSLLSGSDPAVTRADIEKAMADAAPGLAPYGACVDAVHALVSGDDPAVHVVRESDIAAVEVEQGNNWRANGTGIPKFWTAEQARRLRDHTAEQWCEIEAIARAIEAEQAVDPDPVEALAEEFARALAGDENIGGAWSMDPTAWRDIALTLARRAHAVLGQEAGDE